MPAFNAWTAVAGSRHEHEHDSVGNALHLDLALAGPDRFEKQDVLSGRVEYERRLERRLGEAARCPRAPIERMKTSGSRK